LEQWPQSLRACVGVVLGSGYPMLVCWGPAYIMLYNDPYRPLIGTKNPAALGRAIREVLPETWDFLGPRFDRVMSHGQEASHLTGEMFTVYRNNYLEECYFSFSYSPIRVDDGGVGGVFTTVLEMTERVIEDRRRQVLRDLASRMAEARQEEDVWRVSAETFAQHRSAVPFAFLYEYLPVEHQARLASVSAETGDDLHPAVIDCNSESIWRFHAALSEDCLIVELGHRASAISIPGWPLPAQNAAVLPIRFARAQPDGWLPGARNSSGPRVRRHLHRIRSPDRRANSHRIGERARRAATGGSGTRTPAAGREPGIAARNYPPLW
jgi:hypothetical protein